MRKFILGIVLLIASAGAFAQYQGTYWGEDLQVFVHDKGVLKGGSEMGYSYYREPKHMAGQASELYYIFSRNKLAGIAYAVEWNEETEKKILENFDKIQYQKINEGTIPFSMDEETYNKIFPNKTKELLIYNDIEGYYNGKESILEDALKNDNPGNTKICGYNWAAHSTIYIYSNVLNNKIVVVYRPQPEEF